MLVVASANAYHISLNKKNPPKIITERLDSFSIKEKRGWYRIRIYENSYWLPPPGYAERVKNMKEEIQEDKKKEK